MQTPDSIETILARLMPPAISEEGQRELESMLDDLSAGTRADQTPAAGQGTSWLRRLGVGGMAAAGVAGAFIFSSANPPVDPVSSLREDAPPEFVLVSESVRIESTEDEGWLEDEDGSAMRALRLSVVEENSIRDEETGIEMTLTEPREEMLLMPISAF